MFPIGDDNSDRTITPVVNYAIIGIGIKYALSIATSDPLYPLQVYYIKNVSSVGLDPSRLYAKENIVPAAAQKAPATATQAKKILISALQPRSLRPCCHRQPHIATARPAADPMVCHATVAGRAQRCGCVATSSATPRISSGSTASCPTSAR